MNIPKLIFVYAFPLDKYQRALYENKNESYPTISEVRSVVSERQRNWDEENGKHNLIQYICGVTKRVPEGNLECFVYGAGINTMSTPFLFPAWNKFGTVHTGKKFIDLVIHELLHIFLTTNNKHYWEYVVDKYQSEDVSCRNHILLYAMLYIIYKDIYNCEPMDFGRDNLPAGYARAIEIVKEIGYQKIIDEYHTIIN